MANDFYQIFRDECRVLARTMVIKHELAALAMNRYLQSYGVTVGADKSTWRLYMNIAGLYHSTNTMMQVRSLDTGETIDFTIENLKVHRATARGYAYGSRYYKSLVSQWSRQEWLILGILNPIPMETILAARENEIIWMNDSLVEEQEDNLKDLIQAQVDAVLDRWHTETYSLTEDLYDCSRLQMMYAHLPAFVELARTKNSRTERSHSFHIRQFLASNGRLDLQFDAMTLKQRLFFYRNLPYLHRYPGWQDSFDWLKEKVLEDRLFPLADYVLVQNVSNMPDDIVPAIELVRTETTADYAGVDPTRVSVNSVLQKQAKLALRNAVTLDDNETETDTLMENARVSSVQTKVLESSVLDMNDSQVFKLESFLIEHWAYLAHEDRYRAIAVVDHPKTGEPIQLSALDAFILYLWAWNQANGVDLEIVPDIIVECVLKDKLPRPQEMVDLICDGKHATLAHAEALWDMIPEFSSYISTESFYDAVNALYNAAVDQHNLAAYQGNFIARVEVEAMGLYMFNDVAISLANKQDYASWFQARGLASVKEFDQTELETLYASLLSTATGMDLNTSLSLNDIHRAMIAIMQRLSSYSVHFIREINTSPLLPLDNKFMRIGDVDGLEEGAHEFDILKMKDISSNGLEWGNALLPVADTIGARSVETYEEGSSEMIVGLSFEQQTEIQGYSYFDYPYIRMIEPVIRPVTDLSQYSTSLDLVVGPVGPVDTQLSEVIVNQTLSGLNYPDRMDGDLIPLDTIITSVNLQGLNYPDQV